MEKQPPSNEAVSVRGLRKSYGKNDVVKSIDFTVAKGEIFGILGPNGAGKTTTLEMIETLRPIDGGTVEICGFDVEKQPDRVKRLIGVQTQTSSFFDKVTLIEQLRLLKGVYGSEADPTELLRQVDLEEKAGSYPEKLSGGQHQRFSIAAALVNRPEVLFLDEPTTGLDPQARRSMWELIKSLNASGITIILTSHYMEEAQLLCDRVAIMDAGSIIALGKPEELVKELLAKGFKKEKEVLQADLEDVFIDLTGKALRD